MTADDRRPTLLVLAAMAAFATMPLFTRAAAGPVLGVAAWRALVVAGVFAALAARQEGLGTLRRPGPLALRAAPALGLALALASATFVGGYAFTTVANTIFLHSLAPLAVFPLAARAFGERPGPGAQAGAALALLGVLLLSGVSAVQLQHFTDPRFLLGDALALLSAVGYAAVLLISRASRRAGAPLFSTLAWAWGVAAAGLLAVAAVAGQLALPWADAGPVLGLALLSTALPFTLLHQGLQRLSAPTVAVLSLAEVVFATLVGAITYGEIPSPLGQLGGALATLGVGWAVAGDRAAPAGGAPAAPTAAALARIGLSVGLLNAGAALAVAGEVGAPLLAAAGLLGLSRRGPAALSGAAGAVGPIGAAVAAGGALALGALRGGAGAPGLGVGGVALAGLVADELLRRRDRGPAAPAPALESAALALLAVGAGFGALDHAAAGPARAAAAALLAAGGLIALLPAGWGARWAAEAPRAPSPAAAAGALLLAWVLGGLTAVPAGHVGLVERLGAPLPALLPAGLSWRLPPPLERVRPIDRDGVRSEPLLDGAAPLLCGDQSLAALRASLRWSVADPVAFAYGAADTPAALQAIGRAALSEEVGRRGLDDVLTSGRGALEAAARDRAAAAATRLGLGVQIHAIHLAEARVPAPVQAAFSDVISADEERHTTIDEAEAYAARVLPEAGGAALHHAARAAADGAHALARARALDAWHAALAPAPASTLRRLEVEATEARLAPLRLRVLPRDLALWPSPGAADVR